MKTLIILLLLAGTAFAAEIEVKTGFGYFEDSSGNIVSKAELPKGTPHDRDWETII